MRFFPSSNGFMSNHVGMQGRRFWTDSLCIDGGMGVALALEHD